MKTWKNTLISIAIIITTLTVMIGFAHQEKPCCVCDSFRYHAPCLVDLKEGKILELDIYYPHETKVAELAEPQPEIGTFSYIRIGNILGTKLTDRKIAEFSVPIADKTYNPPLCKSCRKSLPSGYRGRYLLADLYDMNVKTIIPIISSDKTTEIRCYQISMTLQEEQEEITVIVQGILDTNNQKVMED